MRSKEHTMKRLADSICILLENTELDKLTVNDIASNCNMTRQIFYHYFLDKYDLVNWIYQNDCHQLLDAKGDEFSFKGLLLDSLNLINEKLAFYKASLNSNDVNALTNTMILHTNNMITSLIEYKTGSPLSSELTFLVDYYCNSTVHCLVNELKHNMQIKPTILCEWLVEALPVPISSIVIDCTIPNHLVNSIEYIGKNTM